VDGMSILLKSMGIDPEEIKQQISSTTSKFAETMAAFKAQLDRIESKLDGLIEDLEVVQDGTGNSTAGGTNGGGIVN
jgi:hypothetical protein